MGGYWGYVKNRPGVENFCHRNPLFLLVVLLRHSISSHAYLVEGHTLDQC